MKQMRQLLSFALPVFMAAAILAGCAGSSGVSTSSYDAAKKAQLEQVKAGRFDGGKMWTFDDPPVAYFGEAYGFRPSKEWLDDARLSSLRLTSGCSASFVSGDGLVMTNHHCVRGFLASVQKPGENLLENGFSAADMEAERKIPNAALEQLVEIRDVTKDVLAAMDAAKTDQEKIEARGKIISQIEKQASDQSKLRAQVVTLYNGGKFSLYLYKRFTDLRLVFAPELQAAHFGGEYDNFTYPRYAFDCSFVRVYENDAPYESKNFFAWSKDGAQEDELVFVIGNPGRTSRLSTAEQLEYNRDVQYPFTYQLLRERVDMLTAYIKAHPEKKADLYAGLLGVANGMKSYQGRLAGLRDDVLVQRRRDFDRSFRAEVEKRPELKAKYGHIWGEIAQSMQALREIAPENLGLRAGGLGVSEIFARAFSLVQLHREMRKAEADRLDAYKGERGIRTFAAAGRFSKVDTELDALTLALQLSYMKKYLGASDPIVQYALQGQTEEQAARRLLGQTVLNDSTAFAGLVADHAAASAASQDPFIVMARMALPRVEKAGAIAREVNAKTQVNATLLGRAQFDVYGTSIPPDATFTLRIADGVVKGYDYNGTIAPPFTTFHGLYDRHYSYPSKDEWKLAAHWQNPPPEFKLSTRCNFSSTNDIIGGNSGSPMINKNSEIVGLIFDGNMESLPGDFIFAEDAGNRTVSVHSSAIMEALRHLYKMSNLVKELESGKRAR